MIPHQDSHQVPSQRPVKKPRRAKTPGAPPEILAIIPVSGQDREFRGDMPVLGSRPLLDYTFAAIRRSTLVGRTIVSTDDRRIADASRAAGFAVPFVRRTGERRAPMAEIISKAVQALERKHRGYRPEWIVRLQVTYPFRDADFIDRAIAAVLAQDVDSAFAAFPEFDSFWQLDDSGRPTRITTDTRVPRSTRPPIFREMGGLFSMVHRSVVERGLLYGERVGIIATDSVRSSIDLHSTHGFELAQIIAGGARGPV